MNVEHIAAAIEIITTLLRIGGWALRFPSAKRFGIRHAVALASHGYQSGSLASVTNPPRSSTAVEAPTPGDSDDAPGGWLSAVPDRAEPIEFTTDWPQLITGLTAELRARNATPAFIAGRIGHVRRFSREISKTPARVTAEDLIHFLGRPEWGYRARKATRASMVDLFTWAHDSGLIPSNPAAAIPGAGHIGPRTEAEDEPLAPITRELQRQIDSAPEHPARTWARRVGYPAPATGRVSVDLMRAWQRNGSPVLLSDAEDAAERWEELLEGYMRELTAQGIRDSSMQLYRIRLRAFIARVGQEEPTEITRTILVDYLADPTWKPETRRGTRSTLATFFRWAHDTGRLPSNPAARLPRVHVPAGVPAPAPETVIRDAINGARSDVRLMVLLGALAGLRRGEIARFHTDCITEDGLRIEGKGGRVRMIPVHPALVAEIEAYRQASRITSGFLFTPPDSDDPYTTNHIGVLISNRMPPGWTAHKLRHRFASRSYAGQYNLRAVQELLGHASPVVTARYVATPDAAAVDAVLAVPPIPGIEAPPANYRGRGRRDVDLLARLPHKTPPAAE